jgi:acyl-coenzyme A thioesterase PaaI-like protein
MKTECMRPALQGETYVLRGDVARLAKQVAYGEATVRDAGGALISRATGTFLLHRPDPDAAPGPAPTA